MRIRFVLLFILILYAWIAGSSIFNFNLDHGGSASYISHNHLAEAFLAGKLNLLKDPDPRILELSDPYEPTINYLYRWQDASVYKGKHYLYFGPAPTLVFYLPFKLITHASMPDTLVLTILVFGTLIWSTLILIYLIKNYFPHMPKQMFILAICISGLANIGPHMVHKHGGIYHVSIASGCFFLTGALFCFIRSLQNRTFPSRCLFLGSLFLGLAAASRPGLIPCGILLFIIWLKLKKELVDVSKEEIKRKCFALFLPYTISLFLLVVYNYLRFDNFFEFGFTYQTGDLNIRALGPVDINNIPSSIYLYLFLPPVFNSEFPYFHISVPDMVNLGKRFYAQAMFGLLTGAPFLWIPLIGWLILRFSPKETLFNRIKFPIFEFLLIGTAAAITLGINLIYSGCSMRFMFEFATPLILLSLLFWFYFYSLFTDNLKILLNRIAFPLGIISCIIGASFGIETIRSHTPEKLKLLETWFKPVSKFVFNINPNWEYILHEKPKASLKIKSLLSCADAVRAKAAIDNNLLTDWYVPPRNHHVPTLVSFDLESPETVKGIWLFSRKTSFYESWKKLDISFYLNGIQVSSQSFSFPEAEKKRLQHAEFNPVKADEITLSLSDPVNIDFKGMTREIDSLSPGYTEILLEKLGAPQ